MSQKNNLDTLFQALDKANRAGIFTLNESVVVYSAFNKLTEQLNGPEGSAEKAEEEEGDHTPFPKKGPKKS